MKRWSTTPVSSKSAIAKTTLVAVALLMAVSTQVQIIGKPVQADQYDDRIKAIQNEIDQYQSQAGQLQGKADSLQKEVTSINNQKNIIQSQIDLKQAEHDKLVAEISDNQQKIVNNQDALGETIANIYVDDDISPLEMLASSKNLSDYIDKQEYRSSVRDELTSTITRIRQLKAELETQKKDVDRVIGEQQLARNALAGKQAEQQNLLNQTRGQEAAYVQLTATREQQKLQVQQAQQNAIEAAIRAASSRSGGGGVNILPGDPNKGGYPWETGCWVDANAWSHGGPNGDGTDAIGYGCRQCVSYAAWRVGDYTGRFPRYWGNANQWPASAQASGYQTGTTPRAHSVGVISAGAYGHVVWVEAVNGDGTVDVSQYNYWNAGGPGWGNYSKMRLPASTYDTYIYF